MDVAGDTCGCRLFFPLTISPPFPPLVFLIISSDTRYSGNSTLLYLRDGWMVESCFLGRYSANLLADGLSRKYVSWGNLGKTTNLFFSRTLLTFIVFCLAEESLLPSTSATRPSKYPQKHQTTALLKLFVCVFTVWRLQPNSPAINPVFTRVISLVFVETGLGAGESTLWSFWRLQLVVLLKYIALEVFTKFTLPSLI